MKCVENVHDRYTSSLDVIVNYVNCYCSATFAAFGDSPAKLGPEIDSRAKKLSNLYVMKGDSIHLVSTSEDAAEICVWNAIQQKAVRRIYGKFDYIYC